ncbi:hypothetical protein EDM80_02710 [bacterium]|nr:MAG: hypothetical protein EDM80_02710 [bacterium]RIK62583.1 MAG: hypothetical protein DCC64_09835 [Planctomycetota bacterium]
MKKTILSMLVVLVAVLAVACGGNKPVGNGGSNTADGGAKCGGGEAAKADPEAQWKALYKKGATWVMHMNMGMEMWQKTEVLSVDGNKAKIKTSMKMKKDEEFANPTESEVEFKKPEGGEAKPDPKYKKLGEGKDKVAGLDCTWIESEYDGKKSKNWTSDKFGLVAKMESDAGKMELVEFTEGK